MDTKQYLHSLEQLNLEIIELMESKEYISGKKLSNLRRAFPNHLLRFLINHCKNKSIKNKVKKISAPISKQDVFYADPVNKGLSGVVYTCITKGYDKPKEPLYADPNLDYVIFSDKRNDSDSVWNYRDISKMKIEEGNNAVNRYYKFHPFEFFENYDFSIYIDGNVQLISDTSALLAVAKNSKTGIAMHRHATMDCLYNNMLWCLYNHRGDPKALKRQVDKYRAENFPPHYGLLEATIIVVDLKNEIAKKIMDAWWNEFVSTKSGRDQISLPYVLWKAGFTVDDIGCLGNDEYHNPKFRIYGHEGKLF